MCLTWDPSPSWTCCKWNHIAANFITPQSCQLYHATCPLWSFHEQLQFPIARPDQGAGWHHTHDAGRCPKRNNCRDSRLKIAWRWRKIIQCPGRTRIPATFWLQWASVLLYLGSVTLQREIPSHLRWTFLWQAYRVIANCVPDFPGLWSRTLSGTHAGLCCAFPLQFSFRHCELIQTNVPGSWRQNLLVPLSSWSFSESVVIPSRNYCTSLANRLTMYLPSITPAQRALLPWLHTFLQTSVTSYSRAFLSVSLFPNDSSV
jgi:hypothetical protein